ETADLTGEDEAGARPLQEREHRGDHPEAVEGRGEVAPPATERNGPFETDDRADEAEHHERAVLVRQSPADRDVREPEEGERGVEAGEHREAAEEEEREAEAGTGEQAAPSCGRLTHRRPPVRRGPPPVGRCEGGRRRARRTR